MYRMIEVVGVSNLSYAEASKSALAELQETEKVYWFEVVEMRGAVRDGKIEFQVKLNVGVK